MHKRHKIAFSIIGQCVHFHLAAQLTVKLIGEDEFQAHFGPEDVAEHICQVCLASLGLAPPIVESRASLTDAAATRAVSANTVRKEGA